jgi:glycogen operon protein
MLLAGDELLHSQRGNNNGYCQDNELSWLDWNMCNENADVLRFVRKMIALRKRHPSIMRRRFLTGKVTEQKNIPDISWHGTELNKPLWFEPESKILAFTLTGIEQDEADLHICMNMSDDNVSIELPTITGKHWCVTIDTSLKSPNDIIPPYDQIPFNKNTYIAKGKSVIVLENVSL